MKNNLPSLTCSNCYHENTLDAAFCENCGQTLDRVCIKCGTQNKAEAKFCKKCGTELTSIHAEQEKSMLSELQQSAPEGLQEKIRATSSQIEGERKPVTILFTDIVGSTAIAEKLDPEVWKEIVSGAHRRVGEAIYRYEGTIAQLLGDGVLAFFGAPITHEDDPIRAIRAAMDIQESVRAYARELEGVVDDFQMRIGINTGTVVIGEIGTDMHMEYLAVGDAVNVAARLQSAAEPGEVMLSEPCARLVSAEFELKDLGEISVKGKAEPLQAYELIGLKAVPETGRGIEGLPTPYVGRAREVEELQSALLGLCEGHGQIVTVMGDAGIGKTRLLEEVMAISPSSIHWLEGRALSYGGSRSYWTITQLMLVDLGLSDGAPKVEIKVALRRRVRELFGEEKTDDVLPYLAHLLGLKGETEAEEHIQSLDGETLKVQTLKLVSEYFGQIADEGPTVFVFEDTHWADPSSLEVLEGFLPLTDRVPLMILMLMRIDRDHGSWGIKIKAETDVPHRYKEFHIRRLSEGDSSSLLEQLLGEAKLPDEIWRIVMERSEGNPFYLEEIVRHLMEQDLIVQDEDGWRATEELEEMGIPDTLQGVLLARIDRLEEEVRRTLQMASVIGKSFLYRILETISEAAMQLDAHLSHLQRVDLIREKARIPELEYIFKHTMTQEAAYNSLLHERRREFHLKVGEALEQLFADRMEEFLGLLAHHFEAAESKAKAVDYLIQAGDKARLEDALEEAIGYYQRALKLLSEVEDEERASQTWLKLGLISMANFDFDGAHRANEAAFAFEKKAKSRRGIGVELDQQPQEPPRNLRIVITGQSGNLDPCTAQWILEAQIINQIFAGLAEIDSEMNVVPHVARSWEVLDGGKRYLFHLRDDVYWTDGSPVTAKDFEWAWIRNLTISTQAFMTRNLDDVVGAHDYRMGRNTDPKSVGVRALDLTTLEVRLNTPIAHFIYLMTSYVTYPLPRAVIERYGEEWWKPEHIISNGAFQLTRYEDEHITLERNPDYFAQFPGNLDRIELFNKLEAEVRLEEYVKGTVDVAVYIPSRLVPEDTSLDEIHSHNFSLTLRYLVFNPQLAPLNDVRVRRALAYALDRRRILEVAVGHGTPPASGIIPAGMPGHSPELGLGLDVSTAQRYLAEAGYPDGKGFPRVNITYSHTSINLQIIPEIVRQWGESLGIEVVFDEVPVDQSTWPRSKSSEIHGRLHGWAADYPDPDSFLRHSGIYYLLQNLGWEDEQYKELVELAARTPNRSRRMAMYRQADHMLVADDTLVVPIWYGGVWSMPQLLKPWVKNYRLNALGYIRFKDVTLEHKSRLTE